MDEFGFALLKYQHLIEYKIAERWTSLWCAEPVAEGFDDTEGGEA